MQPEWLPLRPNSDTALMLGLAHTLASEGLHDRAFLDRYVEGYPRFEDYLFGRGGGTVRNADWAAAVTGIPADQIVALARRMARTRTLVTLSWSVQRAQHGEQPVWATVALAAMLGQIGLPGGGFSLGFGAVDGIAAHRAGIPRPVLPVPPNPVKRFVPVGRFTDALLQPGFEIDYDGAHVQMPELKLIYAVGGNPFHHATNLNRMLTGWQRPETIIVHEPWWSPPAKHADIVLPVTTTMERNDILATEVQQLLIAMRKVIEPVGSARNDFDVFAALAERLGFHEAFTESRDEMGWLQHLYEDARTRAVQRGVDLPAVRGVLGARLVRAAGPRADAGPARGVPGGPAGPPAHHPFREDRDLLGADRVFRVRRLSAASGLARARRVARRRRSRAASRCTCCRNQPRMRLHSQLDPAPASRDRKVAGREPLAIHPADAAARGIAKATWSGSSTNAARSWPAPFWSTTSAPGRRPDRHRRLVRSARRRRAGDAGKTRQPERRHARQRNVASDPSLGRADRAGRDRADRDPPPVTAFDLPPLSSRA